MTQNNKVKSTIAMAVRPNVGLQMWYRRQLNKMIDDMTKSVDYWLSAAYKANEPEMAQDASPANVMRQVMARLTRHWNNKFSNAAPKLGKYFTQKAAKRSDAQLKKILKDAGFSVELKMTAAANDVMQATIGEQVGLIKSIAGQYLTQVEGMVMRSVASGGDLGTLSKDLRKRYGITKRRAALIARDQNNKATATMTRTRQEGLGIKQAAWKHSHAGKEPRPSHVEMDGQVYDIEQGMWDPDVQKYIWPGTEINCRCVSRSILPGLQ